MSTHLCMEELDVRNWCTHHQITPSAVPRFGFSLVLHPLSSTSSWGAEHAGRQPQQAFFQGPRMVRTEHLSAVQIPTAGSRCVSREQEKPSVLPQ